MFSYLQDIFARKELISQTQNKLNHDKPQLLRKLRVNICRVANAFIVYFLRFQNTNERLAHALPILSKVFSDLYYLVLWLRCTRYQNKVFVFASVGAFVPLCMGPEPPPASPSPFADSTTTVKRPHKALQKNFAILCCP